ncbi:MAG: matrixin family metalloprotease [Pirellulales bacterium]
MRLRPAIGAILVALGLWGWLPAAPAAVVVLANRTSAEVRFVVSGSDQKARQYALASGDVIPVPVTSAVGVAFNDGKTVHRYQLDPNSVYYFAMSGERLTLAEIGFSGGSTFGAAEPPAPDGPTPGSPAKSANAVASIPVKILVDEDEPATRKIWEERLRRRVKAASDILERHCRVRLDVVAVDTWRSDNRISDFTESLREFEQQVRPSPARLAIGFTSQYKLVQGRVHLGGTRGPLYPYVLVREWSQHIAEPERLEVLLHELGHYLGAVHSPEQDSVMRPMLGDRQSRSRGFRIGFDPVNTLAMNLLTEEIRDRNVSNLAQMTWAGKSRLRAIYAEVAKTLPSDPAAGEYLKIVDSASVAPLASGTRLVAQVVLHAAERNSRLPKATQAGSVGPYQLSGDALTEYYFRQAAGAAGQLPPDIAPVAYLVGLATAMDRSNLLRSNPATGSLCRAIESDAECRQRTAVLGFPTMRGRYDLTQHFVVSAALAALVGDQVASIGGILKEMEDTKGESGFSFSDLAADQAGIAFADRVRESRIGMPRLAAAFAVADYMPETAGLADNVSLVKFIADFGSPVDPRFAAQQELIRKRILALPGHSREEPPSTRPGSDRPRRSTE